ncbi:MAG: hypothetical protein IT293_05640, partial [Deltaproteobacteria bacterium]|nr:hypothetical protein [Deltaproteobacteria bacterium]
MAGAGEIPFQVSFGVAVHLGRSGFKDLQRDFRREARRALATAFKEMLGKIERALIKARIVCGPCAAPMYSRGRSTRRIVTAFGPIEV